MPQPGYDDGVTTIMIIGKDGCHLCDVARGVVDQVVAELPEKDADRIEIVETSILDDPDLYNAWWEKIPVLMIDGEVHAYWRIAPERLRDALLDARDGAGAAVEAGR